MKQAAQEGHRTHAGAWMAWRLALIIGLISISNTADADGLLVRLRTVQGGCEVSVLTADQILAHKQSEFEVLVQQSESGQLISNALVAVSFRPEAVHGLQTTPEFCSPIGRGGGKLFQAKIGAFSVKAPPRFGAAGIYYSAPVTFPVEGRWQMEVNARSNRGRIAANGDILVSAEGGRWGTLWPFFGAPFAIIAIFGANQWLQMNRPRSLD